MNNLLSKAYNLKNKVTGLKKQGDPFPKILSYWLPELISNLILITLPPMFDSWVITRLGSTSTYGALAMGTNFLHTLIKLAEAIPIASIAIIGRHNGAKEYEECGEGLGDAFWTTFILGFAQFAIIFVAAASIYRLLGVPTKMVILGTSFLKIKSFGVFLIFITLALLGFMRAVKNTRVPMMINIIGIASFIFLDYILVLGKLGIPQLGLTGSALATVVQYSIMSGCALIYILTNPDYKKYFKKIFLGIFNIKRALHLLNLSWPIMLDKISVAGSYIWLSTRIAPMGKYAIASYDAVKNLERSAFLPVMASAYIITFLVSNKLGAGDNEGAMANIKKVYLFTFCMILPAIIILSLFPSYFVSIFDPRNKFSHLASAVLPIITIMLIFDFTQVVLAGALRGAGDVKTVMISRILACGCFFVPVSYLLSIIPNISNILKFSLIYGSFYVTTGIMGIAFLYRIKSRKWQKKFI